MRAGEPFFRVVTEPANATRAVTIEAHGAVDLRAAALLLRVIEFVIVERHRVASVDFRHVVQMERDAAGLLAREWPSGVASAGWPEHIHEMQ